MLETVFCFRQYEHLDDEEFINMAYLQLLDRIPDSSGALYYLSLLTHGETRASITTSLCDSPEGKILGKQICCHKSHEFNSWFCREILNAPLAPESDLATSWLRDSTFGLKIKAAMYDEEILYVETLLAELQKNNVEGDIVEFGIYQGHWIELFWNMCKKLKINKRIIGFDSFEGLPSPSSEKDDDHWFEGQFTASFKEVYDKVKCKERHNIQLIPGFFSDSFLRPESQKISRIAYARIDADLYQSTLECLDYLKPRLVNGAILVFDDWCWSNFRIGETRALYEWLPDSGLKLEFLVYNCTEHLYLRVHKE